MSSSCLCPGGKSTLSPALGELYTERVGGCAARQWLRQWLARPQNVGHGIPGLSIEVCHLAQHPLPGMLHQDIHPLSPNTVVVILQGNVATRELVE